MNYSERILYHGGEQIEVTPKIRTDKYYKDFGWAFYLTELYSQAEKWSISHGGYVTTYIYNLDTNLSILHFDELTEEWLDFVAKCRKGESHSYDIIEGPMADDQVWNYVEDYLAGVITSEAFFTLCKFNHPTHQVALCTPEALDCVHKLSEVSTC